MDHAHLALLMMFIGLALVIAEIFIPSGGMISVLAAVCVAVSIWAAYKAWFYENPGYWWTYVVGLVLLVPASIGGALFTLQRTSFGRRILLEAPSLEEVTPYAEQEQQLRKLIGKRGKAITLLSPGGMVEVDGERHHCEARGILIDPGEEIEVVDVRGNRLVVRLPVGPPPDDGPDSVLEGPPDGDLVPDEFLSDAESPRDPPLDFDVSQS